MSLRGCIEVASSSGNIAGWLVHDEQPDAQLRIEVQQDGFESVVVEPVFERPDIGRIAGFNIDLGRPIHAVDLLSERIVVVGISSALEDPIRLHVTDRVAEEIARNFVQAMPDDPSSSFKRALIELLAAERPRVSAERPDDRRDFNILTAVLSHLTVKDGYIGSAPLNVPIGMISRDGTALVGRDGCLFLVGGGNALINQYLEDPGSDWISDVSRRWLDVIARRVAFFAPTQTRFLQLVIPEKLSVCRDLFPFSVPTRSSFIISLERRIGETADLAESYISGFDVFERSSTSRNEMFPRTDSHLSFGANFLLVQELLRRMGLVPPERLPMSSLRKRIYGDLSERFCGYHLYEEIDAPDEAFTVKLDQNVELIEAINPENAHIGIKYVWRNRAPIYPLKVIAFGNSFFERGGDARCLSWWFARLFSEFHFVWHPNVDHVYVEDQNPDWVIAQTVERFLPTVADC